ncbi:hypothetical protein OBBRIDRAFT_789487 [Obba rivulosa]|uniref:Transmembrane protein n=1 Tax=Obba rivulosa TaxID=1052685 RepID=A0A8E2DQV8_9APHY|nr:hypothetical protein OBBRIDRAFT_789487 [Obba rivulosa]
MWCTRWYLPLVLLPFPVAPPYFLLLFLFATSLRARPCFYCIILLSATFMTSCYWPPVPLHTPLARPWSENVTTFADALATLMPTLPEDKTPVMIPIAERCWCNLSARGFFEPFNVTQWELNSLLRLKASLEQKIKVEKEISAHAEDAEALEESKTDADNAAPEGLPQPPKGARPSLLELVWPFSLKARGPTGETSPASPAPSNTTYDEPGAETSRFAENTMQRQPAVLLESGPAELPWIPPEYDLRPLGFGVIFDFSWTPSNAQRH